MVLGNLRHAQGDADNRGSDDADQGGAADLAGFQGQEDDQAQGGQDDYGLGNITKGQGYLFGVGCQHLGVAQADDGQEHAHAGTDGYLDALGDDHDDGLPYAQDRDEHENTAAEEDQGTGDAHVHVLQLHQGDGENGHAAHARCQGKGPVRVQPHGYGRKEYHAHHGRQDGAGRQACFAHHLGHDGQDVGHGGKRRQASNDFRADSRAEFAQMELLFASIFDQ